MNDIEFWKPYQEFPWVEGSSFGRVRTLDRVVSTKKGMRAVKGRILKQQRNRGGYIYVEFSINGKLIVRYVHRIVAQTFIPNPDNLPEVNHLDNNPLNNDVSNLEWCTREYNMAYKERYGVSSKEAHQTQRNPLFAINLKTTEVQWFESQSEAGHKLGIAQPNINSVLSGRLKQSGGYWFVNADSNAAEYTKQKFGDSVARKAKELMTNKELQSA